VLGLICIVLSLVICFGLTPLFNGAVQAQTDIVRVTKDIKKGDLITPDMVTVVKAGGYNLPADVLKQKDNAVGKYAKTDLYVGDYILQGKLSNQPLAEFEYLTELDGSRLAMSVTIKSFALGLSGKLESGDIVTLVASDYGDFRQTVMLPELQYVKVLAATDGKGYDKEYVDNPNPDDEKALPSTVTLLVTPEQAKILAELEAKGKIHCTLAYRGSAETAQKFLDIQDAYLNPPDVEEDTDEPEAKTTEQVNNPHEKDEVTTDEE